MRKFIILFKKEVKDLLTLQVILPLVIVSALFSVIGNVASKEQEKASQPQKIVLLNQDNNSPTSQTAITIIKQSNLDVQIIDSGSTSDALAKAKTENKVALIVIPQGFEQNILSNTPVKVDLYSIFRNFSLLGSVGYTNVIAALSVANTAFSNSLLQQRLPNLNPETLKNPIQPNDYIVIGDKMANANPALISGFVMQQTMFIPIILFIVIVFSSQMIATAIASEKENKTLETLLTTPVSRQLIVLSKMAASAFIALLSSVIYMFGFRSYFGGITGQTGTTSNQVGEIVKSLGLTFSTSSYILIGLTLFMCILFTLCISLILGAFAEDVKSVAGLTTPIMVLAMIPYFFTMFLDINSFSPIARYALYAIPFSHVFLVSQNLFVHNYPLIFFGIIYQFILFIIAVYIASAIFSTDKIVTMKLNFNRKKR